MTCRITANVEVNNSNDVELPDALRSKVRFNIEAEATHHYEIPSSHCPGEDWVEVDRITYLFVEFDRPPVDGVSSGWYEWEIRDDDTARRFLAAWGVDVDELPVNDWTGRDSYAKVCADAEGDAIDAAYEMYRDAELDDHNDNLRV